MRRGKRQKAKGKRQKAALFSPLPHTPHPTPHTLSPRKTFSADPIYEDCSDHLRLI
ncbi:hypothetical protein [Microcystis aeruginosa]|uniref:hypothetical protein n=1 Tax=Microcystis aeruginosa TaxID=1126 RepID=UPI000AB400B4|nr:hypothetical protein [Microcystis aeruginosa]